MSVRHGDGFFALVPCALRVRMNTCLQFYTVLYIEANSMGQYPHYLIPMASSYRITTIPWCLYMQLV